MQLYPTNKVTIAFQNYGSVWLMVLRGKEEEILLVFNGLWNLKATSGELEFTDHNRSIAKFWSSEKRMYQFFFNRHFLQWDSEKHAHVYARMQMDVLRQQSMVFQPQRGFPLSDAFSMGSASAERPDLDFKTAVLEHAHKEKDLQPTQV